MFNLSFFVIPKSPSVSLVCFKVIDKKCFYLVSLNQCEAAWHSHLSVICSVKERCFRLRSTLNCSFVSCRVISEEGELYASTNPLSTPACIYF